MIHSEECHVGRSVEEVGQADKGITGFHVEKEDTCQERHTLYISHIRSVAGVRSQDIV